MAEPTAVGQLDTGTEAVHASCHPQGAPRVVLVAEGVGKHLDGMGASDQIAVAVQPGVDVAQGELAVAGETLPHLVVDGRALASLAALGARGLVGIEGLVALVGVAHGWTSASDESAGDDVAIRHRGVGHILPWGCDSETADPTPPAPARAPSDVESTSNRRPTHRSEGRVGCAGHGAWGRARAAPVGSAVPGLLSAQRG